MFLDLIFSVPLAFYKKAAERVNSEKNILNSSVECVEHGVTIFIIGVKCAKQSENDKRTI